MSAASNLSIEKLHQMLPRSRVYRDAVDLEPYVNRSTLLWVLLSVFTFFFAIASWVTRESLFETETTATPWGTVAPLLLVAIASAFRAIALWERQLEAFASEKTKLLEDAVQEIAGIEQVYPKALFMAALPYRDLLETSDRETPFPGDRDRLCELLRDYDRLQRNPINYLRAVNYLDSVTSQERARSQLTEHFDSIAEVGQAPSAG